MFKNLKLKKLAEIRRRVGQTLTWGYIGQKWVDIILDLTNKQKIHKHN